MKPLTYIMILIIYSSFVNAEVCEDTLINNNGSAQAINLAKSLDGKNCTEGFSSLDLKKKLAKKKISDFCTSCKSPGYELLLSTPIEESIKNSRKKEFATTLFNDVRKNLSQMTLSLLAMRSTYPLKMDTSSIAKSCDLNSLKSTRCSGNSNKTVGSVIDTIFGKENNPIDKIQQELSYEIANSLKQNSENLQKGLLKRDHVPACGILDHEFSHYRMQHAESLLDEKMVNILRKLNLEKGKSFSKAVEDAHINGQDLINIDLLEEHPLFSAVVNDPDSLKTFLQEVKPGDKTSQIQEKLYSNKNKTEYLKGIESNCTTTKKMVSETLCKDSFQTGNVIFDDLDSLNMAKEKAIDSDDSIKAAERESIIKRFCTDYVHKDDSTLLYSQINESMMSREISKPHKKIPFKAFHEMVYLDTFRSPVDAICEQQQNPNCVETVPTCAYFKLWQASKIKGSPESNLLSLKDPSINNILGSLIGSKPFVDEPTRVLLVQEGILAKPDGTREVQPEIAESSSPAAYHEKKASFKATQSAQAASARTIASPAPSSAPNQNYQAAAPLSNSTTSTETNDPTPSQDSSDSRLAEVEREISRRATQKGPKVSPATTSTVQKLTAPGPSGAPTSNTTKESADSAQPVVAANPGTIAQAAVQPVAQSGSFNNQQKATLSNAKASDKGSMNEALLKKEESGANSGVTTAANANSAGDAKSPAGKKEDGIDFIKVNVTTDELKTLQSKVAGVDLVNMYKQGILSVQYNSKLRKYEIQCKSGTITEVQKSKIEAILNTEMRPGVGKLKNLQEEFKKE